MAVSRKTISIRDIQINPAFRFSSERETGLLIASIRESGILSPLLVLEDAPGSISLLAGFSRFHAAADLELREAPVRVVSHGEDRGRAFYEALLEHLCLRSLNLMEKARVLRIMELLGVRDALRTLFLELLRIPDQHPVLKSFQSLVASPAPLQNFIELHQPPLKMVEPLLEWDPEDLILLMRLADALQLRPVELLEIAGLAREAAVRDGISVAFCLEEAGLREFLDTGNPLQRDRKIQILKQKLHLKRSPRLSGWNQELERMKASSMPPQGTEILWDKTLERPGLEIRSLLRKKADLQRLSEWLDSEQVQRALDDMFSVAG
ncbi:ParB-like nuclease domain-containing protein [bacterium]|nr:ParB-like nuclease domain-containing protein [bacterium]